MNIGLRHTTQVTEKFLYIHILSRNMLSPSSPSLDNICFFNKNFQALNREIVGDMGVALAAWALDNVVTLKGLLNYKTRIYFISSRRSVINTSRGPADICLGVTGPVRRADNAGAVGPRPPLSFFPRARARNMKRTTSAGSPPPPPRQAGEMLG